LKNRHGQLSVGGGSAAPKIPKRNGASRPREGKDPKKKKRGRHSGDFDDQRRGVRHHRGGHAQRFLIRESQLWEGAVGKEVPSEKGGALNSIHRSAKQKITRSRRKDPAGKTRLLPRVPKRKKVPPFEIRQETDPLESKQNPEN